MIYKTIVLFQTCTPSPSRSNAVLYIFLSLISRSSVKICDMKLDSHGKIAILEIIVYIPAILFCIFNNIHYGFRREAGWIYLSIFSISKPIITFLQPRPLVADKRAVKLAGAGMTIDIQLNDKENLITTATILNTVALSPLLSATLSFVNSRYITIKFCLTVE